jgi:hypothetical protein
MIGPKEWGRKKIKHVATLKLLADYTWDIIEKSEHWNFNV